MGNKHVLITGTCKGAKGYFFVDSGSSVSLVSASFVKRMKLEGEVTACSFNLSSFTQNKIPTLGIISLQVSIANRETQHNFIVTELLDTEFLMGHDFLQQKRINLDYEKGQLKLPDGSTTPFMEKPQNVKKSMKIRCNRTTVIPPNTIQYIQGRIPRTAVNYQGVTEPYCNTMLETGLLFANAIVHTEKRLMPLKCINATEEPIVIYKNKLLGFFQPPGTHENLYNVKSIDNIGQFQPDLGQCREPKVSGLGSGKSDRWTREELFERLNLNSVPVQMTREETAHLKDIIWRYRNCFSYDEEDIGCCNMYEAEIKLKEGATPVWTPSRPVPYKLQPEMDRQIESMLRSGVIEPCKVQSDWNSPIFLVKKNRPNA